MIPEALGLPLEDALRLCAERGVEPPPVVETRDPRRTDRSGTLRVIRVKADAWIISRFHDGLPQGAADENAGSHCN